MGPSLLHAQLPSLQTVCVVPSASVSSSCAVSLERRADRKSSRVRKSELVGLCILVAIPLPGTGAWTGALVAALMEMRLKRALPAIYAGVLIAGLLVTLALTGVKALRFLA